MGAVENKQFISNMFTELSKGVFRFANGKVQEVTEYLDTELITAAFGK